MRELVIIFASLVLIFLLNIMLFIVSPYYKDKILTLKYGFLPEETSSNWELLIIDNKENSSNNLDVESEVVENKKTEELKENISETNKDEVKVDNNIETQEGTNNQKNDIKEENIDDSKKTYIPNTKEIEFLNKFDTFFITKKENYTPLLSLFRDYPEIYWLFTWDTLEMNLFWENKYDDVLSYFKEKERLWFWEVNEVNNFWDKSFYFNRIEWKVSLFLEKDSQTYWVFVNNEDYEIVKNILLQ